MALDMHPEEGGDKAMHTESVGISRQGTAAQVGIQLFGERGGSCVNLLILSI